MAARKRKVESDPEAPRKCGRKKSVGQASSLHHLQTLAAAKTKKYLKSGNTTEAYQGYIKRGKEFLASFFNEEHEAEGIWKAGLEQGLSGDGESEIDGKTMLDDEEFRDAFEGCPSNSTPQAIAMFLAFKCFEQGNGKSTADGIHAAFITEYDQMYVSVLLLHTSLMTHRFFAKGWQCISWQMAF